MTIEWVSAPAAVKRTPRSRKPSVTPVAANMTSPRASSSMAYTWSRSAWPLAIAPHAAQGGRGQHPLGGPAGAEQQVDAGGGIGGGQGAADVAVGDEAD